MCQGHPPHSPTLYKDVISVHVLVTVVDSLGRANRQAGRQAGSQASSQAWVTVTIYNVYYRCEKKSLSMYSKHGWD